MVEIRPEQDTFLVISDNSVKVSERIYFNLVKNQSENEKVLMFLQKVKVKQKI